MKKHLFFAHVCACLTFATHSLFAQISLENYPNYVVIGAFSLQKNAERCTADAVRNKVPAKMEINPNRNLYYVYVLATGDRESAFAEAIRLRQDSKYFDAWVYSGPLGSASPGAGVDVNPQTLRATQTTPGNPAAVSQTVVSGTPSGNTTALLAANNDPGQNLEEGNDSTADKTDEQREGPVRSSTEALKSDEVSGKNFYFHLFRGDNRRAVDGEVEVIDLEKARKVGDYQGNQPVKVTMPQGSGKFSFVCQAFGYRRQQIEFDPGAPSEIFYIDDDNNVVVPFELTRLQKGDVAIMYNVFFFKDAAVMRPESKFEVNILLNLLQENPGVRIKIHGHTNGNASGRIIRKGQGDNFFELTGTKQGFGSAKELSEERASVIREYLIANGIAANRMEVKAWGGKKPIHDKNSARASENVRVEVEMLSD